MLAKRIIPLLAVVLAVTAACGPKSSDSSNSSKSNGDTPPNCPSAADINANLGLSVKEADVSGSGRYRVCTYKPTGKVGTAIVTFNTNFDAAKFAAAKTS